MAKKKKSQETASTTRYSVEEKKAFVSDMLANDETPAQYAARVGLSYQMVHRWSKKYAAELEGLATDEVESEDDLAVVTLSDIEAASMSVANGVEANGSGSVGSVGTGSAGGVDVQSSLYASMREKMREATHELVRLREQNERLRKVVSHQQKMLGELI